MGRAVVLCLVGLASPLLGQQPDQARCTPAEYRQFDFWLGAWDVFNPEGRQVGTNTIERTLDGCALHEQWESAAAHRGFSYNIYDRSTGRWHQSWVDNGGLLLLLDGGLENGAMVMRGTTRRGDGTEVLHRIAWTQLAADTVRQLWETSADEGGTWTIAFDGTYVRRQ